MTRNSVTTERARGAIAALMCLLAALLAVAPGPASAQSYDRDPAYSEFYPALDPHGEWIEHPRYGLTWVPFANEDRGWRPYSRGQWVYTEEHGWYWDSEEEFGWVVYHYGRWLMDDRHGWMWVPGTEWGPAWVAWREGEEAIGWAPLPPEADFDGSGALTYEAYASPRYASMWIFVAPAMLAMPAVYRYFHPRTRSTYYFGRSRYATFYGYRDRRIYNRGIDRGFVERYSRRPVPVIQVRPVPGPRDVSRWRPDGDRRSIGVYRPNLPAPVARPPGPGRDQPGWRRPPEVGGPFPGTPGGRGGGVTTPQPQPQPFDPSRRGGGGAPDQPRPGPPFVKDGPRPGPAAVPGSGGGLNPGPGSGPAVARPPGGDFPVRRPPTGEVPPAPRPPVARPPTLNVPPGGDPGLRPGPRPPGPPGGGAPPPPRPQVQNPPPQPKAPPPADRRPPQKQPAPANAPPEGGGPPRGPR